MDIACPNCRCSISATQVNTIINKRPMHPVVRNSQERRINSEKLESDIGPYGQPKQYCLNKGCSYMFYPDCNQTYQCPKCNREYCLSCKSITDLCKCQIPKIKEPLNEIRCHKCNKLRKYPKGSTRIFCHSNKCQTYIEVNSFK